MTTFEAVCAGLACGILVGRLWQYLRDQRSAMESYRSMLRVVRANPKKAEEILESVLKENGGIGR
jgi:hypothetical protein